MIEPMPTDLAEAVRLVSAAGRLHEWRGMPNAPSAHR
jgi:hypothetical protein